MQRLTKQRLTHRLGTERGAVSVLAGLLMAPLIGFTAIAVDVGAIYVERQQLQNGADAAALAVAEDCAAGNCGAPAQTANQLALANHAGDSASLPQQQVTTASNQVTVVNSSVQTHWFAPVLGFDATGLSATAAAAWGSPTGGTAVLPLTFSWCEFALQTGGGLPSGTTERTIYLSKAAATPCTGPSNNFVPGGFGWVETDPGRCAATSNLGGIMQSEPGNSPPHACGAGNFTDLLGTTVLLPIFDEFSDTGNNAWYRVYGYAAFKITGFYFAGQYATTPKPCDGNDRCIKGYFTRFVDLSEAFDHGAAPDLGGRIVYLTR